MEPESLSDVARAIGPNVLYSSAQMAALAGVAGVAFGGITGTLRRTTPLLFAAASGVQFAIIGASRESVIVYQAWRRDITVHDVSRRQRLVASTIAGAVTGSSVAAIFRGRSNVVPGAVVFTLLGCFGQLSHNYLSTIPVAEIDENAPTIMQRIANSRLSPIKALPDAEYEAMLQEKLIRTEAEIALLDERVANMRQEDSNNVQQPPT